MCLENKLYRVHIQYLIHIYLYLRKYFYSGTIKKNVLQIMPIEKERDESRKQNEKQ